MLLPLLLVIIVCALLISAGRQPSYAEGMGRDNRRNGGRRGPEVIRLRSPGDEYLVDTELRGTIARLRPVAAEAMVSFDIATQPNLAIRTDPAAVRQALSDMVAAAIDNAPGGSVLLTAFRIGPTVQISVSDDGQWAERGRREADLRPAIQMIALRGGTLVVDARPGEGTITTLRLPAAVSNGADPNAPMQDAPRSRRQSDPLRLG